MYSFLSARLPPPALDCWPSQVRHATASEVQPSSADSTRPLQRAATAIHRRASIPYRAKPILRCPQGALA
jgi:hypothetical protein